MSCEIKRSLTNTAEVARVRDLQCLQFLFFYSTLQRRPNTEASSIHYCYLFQISSAQAAQCQTSPRYLVHQRSKNLIKGAVYLTGKRIILPLFDSWRTPCSILAAPTLHLLLLRPDEASSYHRLERTRIAFFKFFNLKCFFLLMYINVALMWSF